MDLTLGDIAWIGGALLALAVVSIVLTRRDEIAEFVSALRPAPSADRSVNSAPVVPVSRLIPLVPDTGTGIDTAKIAASLTEAQLLEVLALARGAQGKWLFSGKKLYSLFGGNHNEFVATMRRLRDGQTDLPEEPDILTPIAQRPTKQSYYQDDPELRYSAPPG